MDVIQEAKIVDVHECHTNRAPVETRHLDQVGQRGDRGTVIQEPGKRISSSRVGDLGILLT